MITTAQFTVTTVTAKMQEEAIQAAIANKITETVTQKVTEKVNAVYMEINGQEIRWDEGLSASNILEMLISEYCGINGRFEHVILLFDEFGRYLEYASGVNAAKSGDSALILAIIAFAPASEYPYLLVN